MSKRSDITDGMFATTRRHGLIYTEQLGWIDLGHAWGNDARRLKKQLEQERGGAFYEKFNGWYFPVNYYQEMAIRKKIFGVGLTFHTGLHTQIMVRSCMSPEFKAQVALTIMYGTAKRFEAWQHSSFFNWYTDSGFSVEDLVSDLVGFYRVFGTGPDPLWQARPVSYETAVQIWDANAPVGSFKNKDFTPYKFLNKSPFRNGKPVKENIPAWLDYIKPLDDDYSNLIYNQHRGYPVGSFFKDRKRLNHELYASVSISDMTPFSVSPPERPLFFLLNPHFPQ